MDVMGTDRGPDIIIDGGVKAAREFGPGTRITLVGQADLIAEALKKYRDLPGNLDIQHAQEEVRMTDPPAEAVRRRGTSIAEVVRLHREGEVDAFVSPGNTGAVMGTAMLRLGRLREVKRPAIASFFPSVDGGPTVVLDVGANSDCRPLNLYQFAIMGSIVSGHMFDIGWPRVGLLSIGEEKTKGNDLIVETHRILERNQVINFVGNIEGRDILMGKVDVVVTDGFVGNVVLKFAESIEGFLTTSIRRQTSTNVISRVGAILMHPFLRRLRSTFDYSKTGGAPLLGINGVCIISHGNSSSEAIQAALRVAREMVARQVNQKIESVLLEDDGMEGNSSKLNMNGDEAGVIDR